ncbi:MAG: glycosyltransferase family 4 protein, partial [Vicinamibacteraceae bacterium]
RYSQLLAREGARTNDVSVTELSRTIASGQALRRDDVSDMVRLFGDCSVAHVQFNRAIWGDDAALHNIGLFAELLPCPLMVTVHDIYVPSRMLHFRRIVKRWLKRRLRLGAHTTIHSRVLPARGQDYRRLWALAAMLLVCTQEEKKRLRSVIPASAVRVIPHFVESPPLLPDARAAKAELGLLDRKVVTLLGFIHPRKGHALLVEALARLPSEYVVVFLGGPCSGPGCEEFVSTLRDRAKSLGIGDRLRVTGYVGEPELATYLAATDLGVCPFSRMSASSSLSMWIACRKRILASRIPQIADYNDLAPGAIDVFWPLKPETLAERIEQVSIQGKRRSFDALSRLATSLNVSAIYRQHLDLYRSLADSRRVPAASLGAQRPGAAAP